MSVSTLATYNNVIIDTLLLFDKYTFDCKKNVKINYWAPYSIDGKCHSGTGSVSWIDWESASKLPVALSLLENVLKKWYFFLFDYFKVNRNNGN